MKDIIERHVIVLSQCRYVVLDEADRMVDLGFEADLTFILDKLPTDEMKKTATTSNGGEDMDVDGSANNGGSGGKTRVTTLFSATMPAAVERLSRKYLKKPAVITIGEAGRAVDTVEQLVEFVSGEEKKKYVLRILTISRSVISNGPIDFVTIGRKSWRFSTAGSTRRRSLSSSIKRRRRTKSPRTCNALGCVWVVRV